MPELLINIDHVATLRNARKESFPDPIHAAAHCESAGASGIVFHLREDRRHITERDVHLLHKTVQGKLDFELAAEKDVLDICCDVCPELATLVPEKRDEVTTEGGLDVASHADRLESAIQQLYDAGIEQVALFVDPVARHVEAAAEVGANTIELHTGDYANAPSESARERELTKLHDAAEVGEEAGLRIHAGHGLDYRNVTDFVRAVPQVQEVSIGFAVVARAVLVGMDQAVRDMASLLRS